MSEKMTDTFDFQELAQRGIPLKSFEAGEKVFLQDEPGEHMFIVRTGQVNIITFGTVLENVGPNGIFGEMALIDDAPRSAAAIASEPTEVAQIDKPAFLEMIAHEPQIALHVMSMLATRIRRMNDSL